MGSRQAKLPRRVRAVMNAARCSEGPREAVACALVSCGGGPRASLRVASESGWNCERWARMGGWEERGLPAARVLKAPGASFSLLRVALQRAGWRWRNATFAARLAALRRCGAARLAHDSRRRATGNAVSRRRGAAAARARACGQKRAYSLDFGGDIRRLPHRRKVRPGVF